MFGFFWGRYLIFRSGEKVVVRMFVREWVKVELRITQMFF